MQSKSFTKFGGLCSIGVGIAYILIAVTHLLLPTAQQVGSDNAVLLTSFAQQPTMLMIHYWLFALSGLIGIGAAQEISELARPYDEGLVRWAGGIALLGFALNAVGYFRLIVFMPQLAADFVAGDAATKKIILIADSLTGVDLEGWIRYGGTGLWILAVSMVALRAGIFPKLLAYCGLFTAAMYWVILVGAVLRNEVFIMIGALLGGVIAVPIWFIWIGLRLRRGAAPASVVAHAPRLAES